MDRRSALKNISIGIGITVSSGSLMTLISSCKSDSSATQTVKVDLLNNKEAGFLEEIMDIMLPKTETPGAKELGLIKYVRAIFNQLYEVKDQKSFSKGMDLFQAAVKDKFDLDSGFSANRIQISEVLDDWIGTKNESRKEEIGKIMATPEDKVKENNKPYYTYRFLDNLRYLAVTAYFGSEEIGENHLAYDPIPGEYNGCIPVSEVGNSWSL